MLNNLRMLLFFILAYIFTWSFHLAIPILGLPFTMEITHPALLLYFAGILGPSVSAIFVTARLEGLEGVKHLLYSALIWRFNLIWYLFAVFIVAFLNFANIGLYIKAIPIPSQWATEWIHYPLVLALSQLWVIFGEEYGWRGFALPRLQKRFGPLGASIFIGFFWASWHLPMFFIPGAPQYTDNFIFSFSNYLLLVIFWSIIMTMLYNRTNGSVFICMIFHAFLNIAAFTIRMPREATSILYFYIPIVILSIIFMPRPLFVFNSSKK